MGKKRPQQAKRQSPQRLGSGISATSRTGRKQQELHLERRRSRSARARIGQVVATIVVLLVILGTVFSTLSVLGNH